MLNAFSDWHNETDLTLFIGAGIGAAYVNHDVRFHRPRRNNTVVSGDHTWTFAQQLMAGVTWSIKPNWSLELMYRFYRIDGRNHSQTGTTINEVTSIDLDPHEIHYVLLGLQHSF